MASNLKNHQPENMKKLTLTLACNMIWISACLSQDFDYSFKEKYDVTTPAQLMVSSFDGNIDVVPSGGNVIEVYYIVTKNNRLLKINRKELEEELTLEVNRSSDRLEIIVRNKDDNWNFNWRNHMNVSFKVYVPKETACDLRTSDGNISLAGLVSRQDCKTSDGNIRISDVSGNITGHTSDGSIYLRSVKGSAELKTSDGDIVLDKIAGDVHSSTSDGNIKITNITGDTSVKTSDGDIFFEDIYGSLNANTSDGNIRGNIINLQKELTARTSDGSIDITIPDHLGLDLDIKGESLHVPLTNFSGKSDKKYIKGQSNGGGIAVNLVTSDGHITLAYR
jgi:DUF4097 and DUF4098 domain-containing protein YvlB